MFYLEFVISSYIGCNRPRKVDDRSFVSDQYFSIKKSYFSTYFTVLIHIHRVFLIVIFVYITIRLLK